MSQVNIFLSEEEEKLIKKYMLIWNLPKYRTIKKMINEFKEGNGS